MQIVRYYQSVSRKTILIVIILISGHTFSQLYYAKKGNLHFYADLKKDSVHTEVFSCNSYNFVYKKSDEVLHTKNNRDTIFEAKLNQILKIKNTYYLLYKFKTSDRTRKIELQIAKFDNRDYFRKDAYARTKRLQLYRAADSLSGSDKLIRIDLNSIKEINTSIPFTDYVIKVNHVFDSLKQTIIDLKDPKAVQFYLMMDSLPTMDSTAIYDLLSKTQYRFFYERFLIQQVAFNKPEILINYIDKDPTNKRLILKTIRDHINSNAIIEKINETRLNTKGKRQIVKLNKKKRRMNALAGVLYVTIIMAELALLTLIVVLIAK